MGNNGSVQLLNTNRCKNRNKCWGLYISLFVVLVFVIDATCALTIRPKAGETTVPDTRPTMKTEVFPTGASDEHIVGAHMYLAEMSSLEGNALHWSSKGGYGAAYRSNIDMIKGGYVIKKSGVYYVKSCVTFKLLKERPTRAVSHSIRRNNTVLSERYEEILLSRKDYIAGRTVTSCLGSYLRLVKYDNVYVTVFDYRAIYTHWWSNWFDIMKVHG